MLFFILQDKDQRKHTYIWIYEFAYKQLIQSNKQTDEYKINTPTDEEHVTVVYLSCYLILFFRVICQINANISLSFKALPEKNTNNHCIEHCTHTNSNSNTGSRDQMYCSKFSKRKLLCNTFSLCILRFFSVPLLCLILVYGLISMYHTVKHDYNEYAHRDFMCIAVSYLFP